ncbi:MAG: hypothetical protein WED09_04705 [Homoserinimonas sp.]
MLSAQPQPSPTGDQDLEPGCGGEKFGEGGARIQHLLEVVDHQQPSLLSQRGRQFCAERVVAGVADAEGGAESLDHLRRLAGGRQVDEGDAVRVVAFHSAGDVDS